MNGKKRSFTLNQHRPSSNHFPDRTKLQTSSLAINELELTKRQQHTRRIIFQNHSHISKWQIMLLAIVFLSQALTIALAKASTKNSCSTFPRIKHDLYPVKSGLAFSPGLQTNYVPFIDKKDYQKTIQPCMKNSQYSSQFNITNVQLQQDLVFIASNHTKFFNSVPSFSLWNSDCDVGTGIDFGPIQGQYIKYGRQYYDAFRDYINAMMKNAYNSLEQCEKIVAFCQHLKKTISKDGTEPNAADKCTNEYITPLALWKLADEAEEKVSKRRDEFNNTKGTVSPKR